MIFVTVGTHEQPFDRLVRGVDELKRDGIIQEEVIVQTGYSTYCPTHCQWQRMFSYPQMCDHVTKARIVITHGGPSSMVMPLQAGKTPIVVPRQKRYGEHINDHQVAFTRRVARQMGMILLAEEVTQLAGLIQCYEQLSASVGGLTGSNCDRFNWNFARIVGALC